MGEFHDLRRRSKLPVYLMERNRILLTTDHFKLNLPSVIAFTIPLLFWKYGRYGAWKQVGYGLAGAVAGLLGERGPPTWAP